jgi:hypothetical protein
MAAIAVMLVVGSTMRAAPDQTRPGEMTQGKVWIQNSGRAEAVPVELRGANLDAPLRVQAMNGEANPQAVRVTSSVRAQLLKQEWEYDVVVIAASARAAQILKPLGLAGWETTGVAWMAGEQTTLLLKRPR